MIIKELKGGSFSKTIVVEENGNKLVRKFISRHTEREYGLVRWQSQIRKLQVMNQFIGDEKAPKILSLGYDDDSYYYDIEYFENSKTILDYLLAPYTDVNVSSVFESLCEVIESYKSVSFGSVKGAFSLYIQEEIVSVLMKILACPNFEFLNQKEFQDVKDICNRALELIENNREYLDNIKLPETLTLV